MSTMIRCLIVDDEQDAIDILRLRLGLLYTNLDTTDSCMCWQDAWKQIHSKHYDLIFMDISMPGKSGLDLLQMIPELESEIIFVTAHDEFALQAFDFLVSGYILKPINDYHLSHAVNRALERVFNKKHIKGHGDHANKIGISNSSGVDYINEDEILYFESSSGYTKVIMQDNEIFSSFSIGKFLPMLSEHKFYAVHRSYIINLSYIQKYSSTGHIIMCNGKEIPVSKSLRDNFLRIFNTVTR